MELEKKEEVTALGMRLQALDKDLDWRKEVTVFLLVLFFCLFVCLFFLQKRFTQIQSNRVQCNLSFGVPLFKGHLHSGGTKFGAGKMLR